MGNGWYESLPPQKRAAVDRLELAQANEPSAPSEELTAEIVQAERSELLRLQRNETDALAYLAKAQSSLKALRALLVPVLTLDQALAMSPHFEELRAAIASLSRMNGAGWTSDAEGAPARLTLVKR
jgi:hypothetical protein